MMWLVTGAVGQLGTELKRLLGDDAVYVDRAELDISDEDAVRRFFKTRSFRGVINCAAYTAVDKAEDEPEAAELANHLGAKWLAKYGKCIIHISTDYVFDGVHHVPYVEEDVTNPISVYGKTKLAGEQAVMAHAETAVIIRTAWVYCAHGNNFVKTMLRLGKERQSLNVVCDQIGSPTYAGDLAAIIAAILPQIRTGQKAIYHYTNEGVSSWYDFAVAIMEMAGLPCELNPIGSDGYPTKAKRPYYSVLNKAKIRRDFNVKIRHWREALAVVLKQMGESK